MQIYVIGGGASGFFSAIHNKLNYPNNSVTIIEKSNRLLAKVLVSGGGRCNVTHACFEPKQLVDYYPRGHCELLGPFHAFQPRDTMAWFEAHGVPLKIESDNRVFPVTDSSQSISDCLIRTATDLGINIWSGCGLNKIVQHNEQFQLHLANGRSHLADKLVLATGSSRQGHGFAQQLGHTIIQPIPSLFTLHINEPELHRLSGVVVEKTEVWIDGQTKHAQTGPLLITHWGLSGPSIIKLSAWNAKALYNCAYSTLLYVNLLPEFSPDIIRETLINHQRKHSKKMVHSLSPFQAISQRLWAYIVQKSGLPTPMAWNAVSKTLFNTLSSHCTNMPFHSTGKGVFKDEFVTCGGVKLSEINFKTMESKRCKNVYIVGELLDIDGVTGGFNFQNAWTTGYLSGR